MASIRAGSITSSSAREPVNRWPVTGVNGDYRISDVPLGTYTVRQVVPAGWEQTAPDEGSYVAVALALDDRVAGKFGFGDYAAPQIRGTVWEDSQR